MTKTSERRLERWLLAFVVLVCVVWVVVLNYRTHNDLRDHERQDTAGLAAAQIASCERVNVLRARFNERGEALITWVATETELNQRLLRDPYHALPPNVPPLLRAHARALWALAREYGPVALVDCKAAVSREVELEQRREEAAK